MSAEENAAVHTDSVGDAGGSQGQQLSPLHRITLPFTSDHGSDHTSQLDSPRAVAPKMKKSATVPGTTNDRVAPVRRGRGVRKKASATTASVNVETNNDADKLYSTADASKLANGTGRLSPGDEGTVSGKSDLLENGMVDGKGKVAEDAEMPTSDGTRHTDAASDVEQKQHVNEVATTTGRRCNSVPARTSRQHSNRRQGADESHKITDYFPIRRSSRMTTTQLKKQELSDIHESIRSNRHDGLKVVEIPCKGRGVTVTRPFTRGQFVVEYAGDLVDLGVARQREQRYSMNQHLGCYMYYFQHSNKNYCVDATAESGLLGRLVNHSRLKSNCVTKVVEVDDEPRLILVAARDIAVGEELLYDYGDRSKESLESYPWLAS